MDRVDVATSGETVDRKDRCSVCGGPMFYRCDRKGIPVAMFCGDSDCPEWILELPIPKEASDG